jgi:hypothetical protein
MKTQFIKTLWLLCLLTVITHAQEGWWMREPIRWVQTNLRQVDATLEAKRLAEQLAEMRANVVLMGMGGIAAYYPTQVGYHYASPNLPAGAICLAMWCANATRARFAW